MNLAADMLSVLRYRIFLVVIRVSAFALLIGAVMPARAQLADGTWTGQYTCRNVTKSVVVIIEQKTQKTATAEWRIFAAGSETGSVPEDVFTMSGAALPSGYVFLTNVRSV